MRLLTLIGLLVCALMGSAQAQGLSIQNAPPYTGTAIGSGRTFTGAASTLFAANVGAYNFTVPMSLSAWVKLPTLATGGAVAYFLNAATSTFLTGFRLYAPASQTADSLLLQAWLVPNAGTCASANRLCAPVASINDCQLHHLCTSWTKTGSAFYVDSVQQAWGPAGAAVTANTTVP